MTTTPSLKTPKTTHLHAVADPDAAATSREPWVTKKQLAKHLGRSTRWIELAQRDRGLPFSKESENAQCMYQLGPVDAWLDARNAARVAA